MVSCVIFSVSCMECVITFCFANFSVSNMLLTTCIYLQPIFELKNTLNKIQVFYVYKYIDFSVSCIEYDILFYTEFDIYGIRCFMSFFV